MSYYYENNFDLIGPLKGSPKGFPDHTLRSAKLGYVCSVEYYAAFKSYEVDLYVLSCNKNYGIAFTI